MVYEEFIFVKSYHYNKPTGCRWQKTDSRENLSDRPMSSCVRLSTELMMMITINKRNVIRSYVSFLR